MKAKVNLSWITFIVIAQCVILLISSCIIGITSFYSKRDSISEMLKANTNQVAELLGKDLNSIYTIADNSYLNISVQQALQRDNAQESSVYEKYCTHQLLESLSTSHPAISDMIFKMILLEFRTAMNSGRRSGLSKFPNLKVGLHFCQKKMD